MTILLVDDNDRIRQTIKGILSASGVQFIECTDGSTAIESYRQYRPDWVLMDIMMPKLNGFKTTKSITSEFPQARIIILTNYDDKEFREAARQAGAQEYLLKENLTHLRSLCLNQTDGTPAVL